MDKSVWLQSNLAFDLNKICTQNKVMAILFTIIFLIVANTNGNSIPNHVSNDKQPILVNSSLTNLIEKLNQFKKTYNSTLMNSTLLPFVGMCVNIVSTTKPALQLYDKQDELLCLSYFDMMNNLIGSGNHEYESPENVIKSLTEFDKDSFKKEFCKLFVGTLPTENEKLPYQNAFNQSIEILKSTKNCEQSCITRDKNDDEVIRTTCKLIAGGYHLINKNHHNSEQIEKIPKKIDATLNQAHIPDKQSAKEGVKNDTVPNAAAVATQSKSIVALNNKTTPTSDSKIIAQSNQSAINIINSENLKNENAASTKKTSPMAKNSDVSTAGKAQSETKQLIQTENQPIVDPNEQPADIEGDNNANNQVPDIPDEENSDEFLDNDTKLAEKDENEPIDNKTEYNDGNNVVANDENITDELNKNIKSSHLKKTEHINSDGVNESYLPEAKFEDGPDSNFFAYLMFLMLITIILYVAYHNKTKVLALLIEGRRSRSGYSRNGNRRKHHSAEYRKLDSNLEEAIQSSGQVLSTQIIY